MNDFITNKIKLNEMARAFQTLAERGLSVGEKKDEYWTNRAALAESAANRIHEIDSRSKDDKTILSINILGFAATALELREALIGHEEREFWQDMRSFCSDLADEIIDSIPAQASVPRSPQAVY